MPCTVKPININYNKALINTKPFLVKLSVANAVGNLTAYACKFTLTICLLLVLLLAGNQGLAQGKTVTGKVLDSLTHAPLQNVSVRLKGGGKGTLTDSTGTFRLEMGSSERQIMASSIGYNTKYLPLGQAATGNVTILLSPAFSALEDVTVKYHRGKYRNKDNPAVALMRQVIEHKQYNVISAFPYATFRKYNKTVLSFDNLPHKLTDAGIIHRYHFLFENADTLKVPGKKLIPLYITEVLSQEYYKAQPEKKKSLVLGQKSVDYGEFVDMKGISNLLDNMYSDVDIYNDRIDLFGTQLLSPLADAGPTFYMYFILDTTYDNGVPMVKIAYFPRNPDDLLFKGTLFVPLDGSYAIKKAELGVSKHINLNFVRSFKVNLDYQKNSVGYYYLSGSDMITDLGLLKKGLGLYGERTVAYTDFLTDNVAPDAIFRGLPVDSAITATSAPSGYLDSARSIPLSASEAKAYSNIDSLRNMRSFRRTMDIGTMLTVGYKQAGIFNFGPINTFYSYNPVEGARPQIGGRTTPKLSKSIYAETFLGYGFKDEKVKYGLNLSYSFNHKSIFNNFPLHYLQAGYQQTTRVPGQMNSFSSPGTLISSFTTGPNNQWLYNKLFHIDYMQELESHFSYRFTYQYWRQQPAGSLEYLYLKGPGLFDTLHQITTSALSVNLRWAPHEQFIKNQAARFGIPNHYPIINFSYGLGIKGLTGGQYNYSAFNLRVYKRLYLAPFGFTDVNFSAGYMAGKLPFPLLYIHPANESHVYFYESYNQMNFEEFVSDHYAGVNFDHYFNGFFLNKIPWLKWLKLREVVGGKIVFGGVRDENNPAKNPNQLRFPTINGITSTYVLNGKPYVEGSIGLFNIFKVLRIDLVKRFTYLDHPYITPWSFKFSTLVGF